MEKNIKLSPYFSMGEMISTRFETPDGNEPPLEAVENLINICENWLEPLRERYNRKYVLEENEDYQTSRRVEGIRINQGYRSYQVMQQMKEAGYKPSPTSNHLTGCAVDIRCKDKFQARRYMKILEEIAAETNRDFDELFEEKMEKTSKHGYTTTDYWVHFAVRPKNNRRKVSFIIK